MALEPKAIEKIYELRAQGWSESGIERQTGHSRTTINKYLKIRPQNGKAYFSEAEQNRLAAPKERDALKPEPLRALDDFGYWRHRYLGRDSTPWQEEAGHSVIGWLASPETEFIVMNMPPGSGKTTLWSDIVAWLICRDRGIRIIWMSHVLRLAAQPVNRVRRVLERTRPVLGAEACLSVEYGRFKPQMQDIWRREEFTVTAKDEEPGEEKEPTVAAYGMDSGFLGHRGNLLVGDDLVVGAILRTYERIEEQQRWWTEEGETRVEPGGACVLNGQRMGAEDLYRFSLDQKLEDSNEPRYRHVVFPAHFEDRCVGAHDRTSPAYPQGCLLDPVRLPWKGSSGLLTIQHNRADKYRVQYQQEDVDPQNVLVQKVWIDGGRDSDGVEHPGCWDKFRGLCEWPRGLSAPFYSIATADPSPTKFWAVEWWLYHPASDQRFLLDIERRSLDAPDFLDWNDNDKQFFGLAQDWQVRSRRLGLPITHWIVENNAAQRFLLQYDHTKRWQRKHDVTIIGHSTTLNKLDPEYGIQMLANKYRFGNVRLPGKNTRVDGIKDLARTASMKLVDEATRYPDSKTDDCLMAQWFFEFNLPHIAKPQRDMPRLKRPSWMRSAA